MATSHRSLQKPASIDEHLGEPLPGCGPPLSMPTVPRALLQLAVLAPTHPAALQLPVCTLNQSGCSGASPTCRCVGSSAAGNYVCQDGVCKVGAVSHATRLLPALHVKQPVGPHRNTWRRLLRQLASCTRCLPGWSRPTAADSTSHGLRRHCRDPPDSPSLCLPVRILVKEPATMCG